MNKSHKKDDDPPDPLIAICERITKVEMKVNAILWLGGVLFVTFLAANADRLTNLLKSLFHIG